MTAQRLLQDLHITHVTNRHIGIIENFISENEGEKDLPNLLSSLGEWDDTDFILAKQWFNRG